MKSLRRVEGTFLTPPLERAQGTEIDGLTKPLSVSTLSSGSEEQHEIKKKKRRTKCNISRSKAPAEMEIDSRGSSWSSCLARPSQTNKSGPLCATTLIHFHSRRCGCESNSAGHAPVTEGDADGLNKAKEVVIHAFSSPDGSLRCNRAAWRDGPCDLFKRATHTDSRFFSGRRVFDTGRVA